MTMARKAFAGCGLTSARAEVAVVQEGLFRLCPPRLLGMCCRACGQVSFPAAMWCPYCRSSELQSRWLSITGLIFSYTIVRVPVPGYTGPVPYGLGVVELPDGIRVNSVLVADPLESLSVGARVRFRLLDVGTAQEPLLSYGYELDPT
jgi:uncharacterized OB-fold protein